MIFDLDGTLIDTMGSFADLAGELIRTHYGWSFEIGRKRYLETSGIPFFQQLAVLFPENERNPVVAEHFETRKIRAFMNETVSEKTRETLKTLRDLEIRTAISSNNFHTLVREFIRRENIPVDLALGFKPEFCKGRPHFDYIRKYFAIPFSKMLFVGDSLRDAILAKEANIRFAAKLGTFSDMEFKEIWDSRSLPTIYEIYEILDILEEL
ncbi:HAD family hydrolase [candidate division KSB1 bacterium]|nr:HAD family hydrolase [candidate division KSB1 bacterium]NIR72702.1 HAD family hydrolase [candidate division KSB1 bacterium]NIS26787.1 HAD family hydrolase [candidate division KSB1 bacterium]NIT73581.1 HAD family hydrolase [candidate division KSB1 bacterium]NIU27457.1 HAD family hydrolase [candidate division KSB1 bacterium]